jgi:DHA1 family bicyclomycin/chloramphenicol resistance-like MFS transporter
MLLGRVLQGVGIAGPRIVSVAMVRDCYSGNAMARIMSLVMTIFILVPIIAPAMGQGLLLIGHWRLIFVVLLTIAVIASVWLHFGQRETLAPDRRRPLSIRSILAATLETLRQPVARGYTAAAGCLFGAFLGYLNSAAQIFQVQYGLGALFPLVFAALSLAFGAASLLNARLVMRLGMQTLARAAIMALAATSALFLVIVLDLDGHPPLWAFLAYLAVTFFAVGMLFGNFNALAMEPLGHIAGVAAGVIGTVTTLSSMLLGATIGFFYDGTIAPVVGGFAVLGFLSMLAVLRAERGRRPTASKPGQ